MESAQKQKRKILYCITKSNWGGAQRYVYDLAMALPREKFDVAVVLGGNGKLKEELEARGIRTISVKALQRDVGLMKDFSSFFELIKIFRAEKPDIIHLNSSKMGAMGGFAGRISRVKKIIFTAHGWAYNEDRNILQKLAIGILHFITVVFSHITIAVSHKAKDQFWSAGLMKKKIIVIHNGIDEIRFLDKEDARQNLAKINFPQADKMREMVKTNPLWIGTISELHKNKGLEYAIEGIKRLSGAEIPNWKGAIFVIMGEGEERNNLEKIIRDNNLENSVFLIGNVENASSYLKALDIFTLTSITEALPYAILEAGKAGVPIIASNVGGISEIIDDMKSGALIHPKRPREISSAIEYLASHLEKKESFSALLKQKIDKEFSLERMTAETVKLYN